MGPGLIDTGLDAAVQYSALRRTGNVVRTSQVSKLRRVTVQDVAGVVERTLSRLRRVEGLPVAAPGSAPGHGPAEQRPKTLADLYTEHRSRLVRLAILLVDEPTTAEDVVQEAFAGLHRNWAGLRNEQAALGYLRTAVVNGSRSVLRRRRTAREYVPPHAVTARSAESLALMSAEYQAVVDALATLPPRQREVLVLRFYGGLSEAEIAEVTGITRGAVKSTASRALNSVAATMAGTGRPGRG